MAKEDKIEIVGGRKLVIAKGGEMSWEDDGAIVSAAEYQLLKGLDAGDKGFDARAWEKQNPDLKFYKYEANLKDGERLEPNPIRGFVIDAYKRPEFLDSEDDEQNEDGEDQSGRIRMMATILLTKPTLVGIRGKKTVQANIGDRVLMDLNHATRPILQFAMPRFDRTTGDPIRFAEIAWVPKMKQPFEYVIQSGPKKGQKRTRQAWRGDLYGGFNAGTGFRVLEREQIKALGARASTPAFLSEEAAAKMLGLSMPGEVPMLGAGDRSPEDNS